MAPKAGYTTCKVGKIGSPGRFHPSQIGFTCTPGRLHRFPGSLPARQGGHIASQGSYTGSPGQIHCFLESLHRFPERLHSCLGRFHWHTMEVRPLPREFALSRQGGYTAFQGGYSGSSGRLHCFIGRLNWLAREVTCFLVRLHCFLGRLHWLAREVTLLPREVTPVFQGGYISLSWKNNSIFVLQPFKLVLQMYSRLHLRTQA